MSRLFRLLLCVALLTGQIESARAGAGTITTKDASGATQTFVVVTDGSSHYLQSGVLCDGVAGANCAAVKPASTAAIATDPAVVVAISPNSGVATAALQGTNTATTSHTCSVVGFSELGCLGQMDDDIKGPIAAGTNLIGKVGIDQTTPGATNGVQINAALPAGTNLLGKTGIDQTTFGTTNGVVSAANTYNTIAASQSAQVLSATQGGGTGATGDYLSHCTAVPGTTSPGVVTILDNATTIYAFAGGASSVSNLVPFTIPVGAKSTSGAWKITTGTNVTVACVGKFS